MIILRYMAKEVTATLVAVTLILLFIFVSNQFVRYLGEVAAGKLLVSVLFRAMLFQIPYLLGFLLPLGLFLGILLVYGRFYCDNEMTVLSACGFSDRQLLAITMKIAFIVMLLVSFITLWLWPKLLAYKDKLMAESDNATIIQTVMPGRFQADAAGHQVYYVEEVTRDKQHLSNIFIAEQKKEADGSYAKIGQWTIVSAAGGYVYRDPQSQAQYLVATDGYRYLGQPGAGDFHIAKFSQYGVRIPTRGAVNRTQVEEMSLKGLWQEMNKKNPLAYSEFQWRFAMPIATLLLALIAVPLSYLRPRQGRYARIFPSILIFTVYANMLFVSRSWLEKGKISPYLGTWIIHAGLLLLAIILWLDLPGHWHQQRIKRNASRMS